ncbi:M56 family metallopeptidase [Tunturibacter empetritectus]|uniref:Beta-lactamase regulating signal transducer with metallopeptidase domain n=1 Tax=Tunturiibacter lichenicola TaxID=2051959 RepID=A0A7W8N4K7_9BACT|nr:M56 family metallopeptidase [Edaphobacter lichenicola]MBB5344628.1 beta-lactamase regulating signal transducer with metallopeptidase domain [Edaphobacter lichenicola]
MIERTLVEYVANALWQLPMLAGGAWLLLAAVKAGPRIQHGVWLMVLGLAVVLPLHGMGGELAPVRVRPDVGVLVGVRDVAPAGGDLTTGSMQRVSEEPAEISLRPRRVEVSVTAARWVVSLYAGAVIFGLWRVIWAWRAARRLVERSREVTLAGEQTVVLGDYGRRLRIRLPQVRESVEISSPMIVGVIAPVLLLPVEFARYEAEEMRAALLHELAHVKRRDTLENALCQLVALPVSWHPVTQWVQGRIRRTREMVCDAMAAEEMRSEIGYARCLLALAKGMMAGREFERETAGVGLFQLFHSNVLEERVMRLMESGAVMGLRTKLIRAASGAMAMVATMAVAAMFHLTPTMAQEQMQARVPEIGQSAVPEAGQSAAPQVVPDAAPQVVPDAAPQVMPDAAPQAAPNAAAASDSAERKVTASRKQSDVVAKKGQYIYHWDGSEDEPITIVNGRVRKLTPEERRQIRQQMEKASKEIAAATARINSPKFKKQIEEAAAAAAKVNSPEFKRQIAEAQLQAQKANEMVHSEAFKEQMAEVQRNLKAMEMPRIQEEIARATAEVNSPEFKQQMADMQKELDGVVQQRMAEAMKQMKEAQEEMKEMSPK